MCMCGFMCVYTAYGCRSIPWLWTRTRLGGSDTTTQTKNTFITPIFHAPALFSCMH